MAPAPARYYYTQSTQTDDVITISLWPYRSLSVRGFRIVIGLIALALSAVGIGFMLIGAWPVIGFLGLEIAIVWVAFKLNYRAGRLIETISINKSGVSIETIDWRGHPTHQHIDSPWVVAKLTHKATGRIIFARGAVQAARFAATAPKGLYSMKDVLGLKAD